MSLPDPRERERPDCALTNVQLIEHDRKILVCSAPATEPFPLPLIPRAMTDWLGLFGTEFHKRTGRCVAALLLLDPVKGEWRIGFPHQRCGRDAPCWTIRPEDFPATSRALCIGGTFQMRVPGLGEQPRDAVPPSDGLHLVMQFEEQAKTLWSFLRLDEEVRRVPASAVIEDDLSEALQKVIAKVELL